MEVYRFSPEDGTEYSSRAVEKLLRHGRKYNLHGWISTQRIAHLNTNALQQLHRTSPFQNGDWLMASFKATNTQNVPVLFHALNNEEYVAGRVSK